MRFTRRTFLMAAGASGAVTLRAQSPPPPPAPKIVSSVVLRNLAGTFDQRLAAVARAGIQAVELTADEVAGWSDAEMARVRRLLRSYGLTVDTLAAAPGAGWADAAKQLELANKMEAPMLLLAGTPGADERTAALRRAGNQGAKAGVTILLQNVALVKQADHQQVRLAYDVFAEQARTGDVVKGLEAAAPWVKLIHVADSPGRGEPGSGSLPFDAFYKAAAKLGYEGPIAMAFQPKGDPAASLIRAVDSMRRSLAAPPPATVKA